LALDPTAQIINVVGGWTPSRTYEPTWSQDRAADYLSRWQQAAQATFGPGYRGKK